MFKALFVMRRKGKKEKKYRTKRLGRLQMMLIAFKISSK